MPKGGTSKFGLAPASPTTTTQQVQNQSQKPVSAFGVAYSDIAVAPGTEVSVDPNQWTEYQRLSSHPFAGDPQQQNLANLQSGWEKAKNAVVGGGINIAAGFMDALGSWDLKDTFDMAAGIEKEYGNWFHDVAKNLSNDVQKDYPIYEKNPGSVSPSDPGWWASQGQSLGFTLGYAAEALVEQIAIGAATGGLGEEVVTASKIKALDNISKAARLSTVKEALWGSFKGIQEATTNGYQTFDETKKKYIDQGYTDDKATRLASVAASEGFRKEVGPLMALSALQYSTLAYNPKTKKFASAIFGGIKNKGAREVAELGTEMLSEGFEEGWQTIASDEGKHKADVVSGKDDGKSFSDRMQGYLTDSEVWNSAIGGVLGGIMFTGGQYIKNAAFKDIQAQQQEDIYKRYEQGLQGMTINYLKQIREAEDNGDVSKANYLRKEMSVQQALQSHHIDHLRGEGSILNDHLTTLQGILKAANEGDTETLSKFKIDEQGTEDVKSTFPTLIQDAKQAIGIYDNIKNTNDESVLVPLAYRQYLLGKLNQESTDAQASINRATASIPDVQNLSLRGQELLNLNYQHEASTLEEERLKTLLKQSSGETSDHIKDVLNNLGLNKKSIENRREEILNEDVDDEQRKIDNEIIKATPHQSELLKAQQRFQAAQSEIKRTRKELTILSDKKYQVSSAKERNKRIINSAENTREVDAIVDQLKKSNQLTPELQNTSEFKKKDLLAQQVGQQKTNEVRQNEQVVPEVTNIADNQKQNNVVNTTNQSQSNTQTNENQRKEEGRQVLGNADDLAYSTTREGLAKGLDFSNSDIGETIKESDWLGESKDNKDNFITIPQETIAFLPDQLNTSATLEAQNKVKQSVKDYVEQLAIDKNKEPNELSFREFLQDAIRHSDKDSIEKNFNYLKAGWKLNEYKDSDFDRDYKALFGTRIDLAQEMIKAANEAKQPTTPDELHEATNKTTVDTVEKTQDTKTEELPTGEKIVRTEFKTVNPNLKLAFLNMEYTEQEVVDGDEVKYVKVDSNKLLVGTDIDSRELMNPFLYQQGTSLSVHLPDNHDEIMVTDWSDDYQNKKGMSFAAWAANKGITPNSDEWIAKVPLIVKNSSGKAVAMIHDTEWYNPENIGLEDSKEDQDKIIAEARAEVLALRKAIMNNSGAMELTITEKKLGTKKVIPTKEPLVSVNEACPQSIIGFPNSSGAIINQGEVILPEQLINTQKLDIGTPYDLRHVGMITIGKKEVKQYLALPTFRPQTLSSQIVETVTEAMRVYLGQNDHKGKLMAISQREQVHKKVLEATGLNLYDANQLEQYIGQFIRTERGDFTRKTPDGKYNRDLSLEAIYNSVNTKPNIGTHTPFIALQKGAIVYGINNKKLAKTHAKFADPDYINRSYDEAVRGYNQLLNELGRLGNTTDTSTILQRMSLNISESGLKSKSKIAFINNKGEVTEGKTYNEFVKDNLQTNVKSFNVSTEENPVYATLVQPVIHYTYKGENQEEVRKEEIVAPTNITEMSDRELRDSIEQNADLFAKFGLNPNDILGSTEISLLPNYSSDTDELISKVKADLTKVGNMDIQARNDTVRFIARQVESKVDAKFHASVDKNEVLKATRGVFEDTISKDYNKIKDLITQFQKLYATGNFPNLKVAIDTFQQGINQIDQVKANWDTLVEEALQEVYKTTGITEVAQTIPDLAGEILNLYEQGKAIISQEELDTLKQAKKGNTEAYREAYREAVEIYNSVVELSDDTHLEEIDLSDEQFTGDTEGEKITNFSKVSLEENNKETVGYVFRRFLSQIPEYNTSSKQPKTGFAGLTIYPGFDAYFDRLGQVLTSPTDVPANYEAMIQRLKDNADSYPWINDFLTRLDKADPQIKAAFVYGMNLHGASFKFVMHSRNKSSYTLKVYDTNANEIERVIQKQWSENFKSVLTDLTKEVEGGYAINTEVASTVLSEFESWKDKAPSIDQARKWLTHFGIFLSPESMKELHDKGYRVPIGNYAVLIKYVDMFQKSSTSHGVFGLLYHSLKQTITESTSNPQILNISSPDAIGNPMNNATKVISRLARIEKKYSRHISTTSVRDGSKNIYGLTNQKMALQQLLKLKTDEEYRQDKLGLSFDSQSYILNLLNTDMDFREKFSVDHISINAIKELGKKLYKDNEITSISESDHELVKLGMFQDIQQGEVKPQEITIVGRIFKFEMILKRMFFPTMSDKSQMLDVSVPAIKMRKGNELLLNDKGEVSLSNSALAFAFSQLVEPELKRMISHHRRAALQGKHPNELTNQKAYNLGAQIFLGIPELNNIQLEGVSLPHYVAKNAETLGEEHYNKLISDIKESTYNLLQDHFKERVANKLKVWSPFTVTSKEGKTKGTQFMNSAYLEKFKESDPNKLLQYAAYDYVFNSYIANSNISMLFAGDPANFSQDKAFKSSLFHTDNTNRVLPYAAKDGLTYSQIVKNIIDVNIGKRLAMLIAPGKPLYNSTNDKYVQLFLQDRVTATTNIPFLVKLYHGASAFTKEVEQHIANLTSEKPKVADKSRSALENLFPDLADYFGIESTDAQEYTTAKEAIDILFRQGRLHSSTYNTLLGKLDTQYKAESENRAIPESSYLTDEELKLVFQPIKPVYSGQILDKVNDVSRVMYIKSSSFPLLPQTTQGTELDGFRRDMEAIQAKTGKNVRASYDTANKVGAVLGKNQLRIWDNSGKYLKIDTDTLSKQVNGDTQAGPLESAMILDREHFRIQQDVPYKSSKRTEDVISIGTQSMKLLFGDGVMNITEPIFEFEGKQLNGQELYQEYTNTFSDWITNEKTKLYLDVGIDETTGKATNIQETAKKLQKILQSEATKRGYPQQDIDALSLEADGSFTLPVWLSPNSNRYEALLNAIVANRLINLKLPGNSFVAGSEEGFRTSIDATRVSNVVYTSAWTGELKAAEYNEDGSLKYAQVLLPSKFRNNRGELIDLIKDGYAVKDDTGKWTLSNKVSKELLNLTSFRIPTSGHISLSQIEIAGFFPQEQGDLMIVPKNFTKQKGLDFDVDKEYTYQLWHTLDTEGNIVPISKDNVKQNTKSKTKLAQNKIIRIHSAILGNKDERIQQKINKVLSLDFARKQANIISSISQSTSNTFSIWDDEHQKYKLGLGAAGKSGIGVYSNYVVFHSLVQQSPQSITLMDSDEEGHKFPMEIVIGNLTSQGHLGAIRTLDGDRTIGEVLGERQNTATDNEKEQIMGRVGVNDLTINVDSLLTLLGFDKSKLKGGQEVSVPYLILSQPIIKDYVEGIRARNSTTSGFQPNKEQDVIDQLNQKYSITKEDVIDNTIYRELTGQKLYDMLSPNNISNIHQQAVLQLFLKLNTYAREVGQIQQKVNVQRTGLGKSVFEMLEKYQNVNRLAYSPKVSGISSLIGDFIQGEEFDNTPHKELTDNGYHIFTNADGRQYAVKPLTPIGHILVNSTKAGYEMWSDFFPHQHPVIQATMENLLKHISKEDATESTRIQRKYEIMQEMKKYLFSSQALGLYTGDVQQERARLFVDTKDNMSLATYLSKISNINSPSTNLINTNKLISAFTYQLNKNGEPSLFKYDTARGEDINEEYKYLAIVELMDRNELIKDDKGQPILYNNQPYTTRQLAKDMIIYTYLQGGIQKATEIVKYIPIPYLKASGFSGVARQWQEAAKSGAYGIPKYVQMSSGENEEYWTAILGYNPKEVGRFERQFMQHNPNKATQIFVSQLDKVAYNGKARTSDAIMSFTLKEDSGDNFLRIRESGEKEYLFERNQEGVYERISVLGTSGLSEYSIRGNRYQSVVNPVIPSNTNPILQSNEASASDTDKSKLFGLDTGNLTTVLTNIVNDPSTSNTNIAIVAKELLPFAPNIPIKIGQTLFKSVAQYTVTTTGDEAITLNEDILRTNIATNDSIADTIVHEYIHALTTKETLKYLNPNGTWKEGYSLANVPQHIIKLNRVFNEVVKAIGPEKIQEFNQYFQENKKLRDKSDMLLYAGMDISELLTVVMTNKEVQQILSNTPYKATDKSIYQQFVDVIYNMLEQLGIKRDTLTHAVFESVFEVAQAQKESTQSAKKGNFDITSEIDKAQNEVDRIRPMKREYTPENIISLGKDEIFVFGSNAEGVHGKGGALIAKQKFGAMQGKAKGRQGQSYAIITKKDWRVAKSSTLDEIYQEVIDFNDYAKNHPELRFYVTKLGSSLAGYSISEMKQVFKDIQENYTIPNNVILPKEYEVRDIMEDPENSSGVIEDSLLPSQSEIEAVLAEIDRC